MTASFPALELEGYSGKRLGRFEVMCKLGAGGMSEVFLAWQSAVGGFKRPVVLKRASGLLLAVSECQHEANRHGSRLLEIGGLSRTRSPRR